MAQRKLNVETDRSVASEMTVPYLIALIKQHFRLLIVAAVFSGLGTAAYNYVRLNDIYASKAVLMPKTGRSSAMDAMISQLGAGTGLGAIAGGLAPQSGEIQQFVEILKSERHLMTVVKLNQIAERLMERPPSGNLDAYYAGAVRELRFSSFSRAEYNSLVISSSTWDPALSQDIVTAHLEALQGFLNENIITQSRNAEIFIQERLKEATKNVDEAESYLTALTTGEIRAKGRSMESQIFRARREYARMNQLLDLLSQQNELAQIESKRNDPKFLVIEPPTKPITPVGPKRVSNALLGALVGFIMMAFGVIGWNRYLALKAQGFV